MPFLDWVNKSQAKETTREVPYHLLKQEAAYGEPSDNLLIQGDNLLALKALIPFYAGRVNCIFIDPPYNTQSAFEHYDDKLEHSQWLSMMYPRLVLLRELLAEDGSIWVTVDDNEAHYFKVLMDEVFGRLNFVANVIWKSSDNSNNDAKTFSVDHNHLLVYSRTKGWLTNKLDDVEAKRTHFKNPDNDPRGPWFDGNPLNSPKPRPNLMYRVEAPNGYMIEPPANGWRWEPDTMQEKMATGEIRFNETMTGIIRRTYLADMKGLPPSTLWVDLDRTGHNRQAKSEQKKLWLKSSTELFSTPKPERLLREVMAIATQPDDLVLDSFLGSGTTAAVAHKMGRRYIGIEMGDHARTHCIPRLQKVIEGEQGGISKDVGWQGGGGFRFCTLGDAAFDEDGRISESVRFASLAAFVWHFETGEPSTQEFHSPMLGVHNGVAYYLLFNGILGDRRPTAGNVLTKAVLQHIKALFPHDGPMVIYGETTRLGEATLAAEGVTFKQIPYDVKVR